MKSFQKSFHNSKVSTGMRFLPKDPPFKQENLLLAEAKVKYMGRAHTHRHTQLKGFITLDNLEAALKYQKRPEHFERSKRGAQRTVNR